MNEASVHLAHHPPAALDENKTPCVPGVSAQWKFGIGKSVQSFAKNGRILRRNELFLDPDAPIGEEFLGYSRTADRLSLSRPAGAVSCLSLMHSRILRRRIGEEYMGMQQKSNNFESHSNSFSLWTGTVKIKLNK